MSTVFCQHFNCTDSGKGPNVNSSR